MEKEKTQPEKNDITVKESPIKLNVCHVEECEARCCYDGVYLKDDEDTLIQAVVEAFPDLFPKLPNPCIAYSEWGENFKGNKTATRPYTPTNLPYPAHFTQTRCAFLTETHRCSLQSASEKLGFHKWTLKPQGCWSFPLDYHQRTITPPPLPDEPDPNDVDESYPGYVKFTPCGMHTPLGDDWHETLQEEIAFLAQNPCDPSWHRFGMTLDELIQRARERHSKQPGRDNFGMFSRKKTSSPTHGTAYMDHLSS